jgi:hypothetical protein
MSYSTAGASFMKLYVDDNSGYMWCIVSFLVGQLA